MGYGNQSTTINNGKIIVSDMNVDLNNVNQAHTQIYTYSGQGEIHHYLIDVNSPQIEFRLVIDGVEMFNIDANILENLAPGGGELNLSTAGWIKWDASANVFTFHPPQTVTFTQSFSIEARANSTSNTRHVQYCILTYETRD